MINKKINNFEEYSIIKNVAKVRELIDKGEIDENNSLFEGISNEDLAILKNRLEDSERVDAINDIISSKNSSKDAERLNIALLKLQNDRKSQSVRKMLKIALSTAAAIISILMILYNVIDTNKSNLVAIDISVNKIHQPTLITEYGDSINISHDKKNIQEKDQKTEIIRLQNAIEKGSINAVIKNELSNNTLNKLIIPSGYKYNVKLNDGTEIILNANSTIEYPTEFNDSIRYIKFAGEGYFKVAKSDKPFIVEVDGMLVKVFGTEFNIKNRDGRLTETVLISGSVGVENINDNRDINLIMLKPNQLLKYDKKDEDFKLEDVNVTDYISWLDNIFIYNDTELKIILLDIEAKYGASFNINKNIDDIKLTFRINHTISEESILTFIEKITNVKFVKERSGNYSIE